MKSVAALALLAICSPGPALGPAAADAVDDGVRACHDSSGLDSSAAAPAFGTLETAPIKPHLQGGMCFPATVDERSIASTPVVRGRQSVLIAARILEQYRSYRLALTSP